MNQQMHSNEFLEIIYALYDHVRFGKKERVEETRSKFSFFNKKEIHDPELDRLVEKSDQLLSSIKATPPSFDRLWDFCEFIRTIEKIFFYNNSVENTWYIEYDINNPKEDRKFCYKTKNKEIRFILTHDIFSSDIISIHILRNYGKKMETKYSIADGQMNYPDYSDLYLINEINRILMDHIHDTFKSVVKLIIKNKLDEVQNL
ncbi:MAG: hypothetical protein NC548_15580 [Lachnospiraceae bacterium]|nr:hypothetical protein [Lachnospiraceae bacterium]